MANLQSDGPWCESRREFLKKTATVSAGLATAALSEDLLPAHGGTTASVVIVLDPAEPALGQPPLQWAIGQLQAALEKRGIHSQTQLSLADAPVTAPCILVSGSRTPLSHQVLSGAGATVADVPESLTLLFGKAQNRTAMLACAADVRGLVYALLELADRVKLATDPLAELKRKGLTSQQPANQVRSIARLFASDVEDKSWFNDRTFWQRYLTELATHRFNRFSLLLGLGYDFPTDIRDAYFHFAYPFLVSPTGYDVRAVPLPEGERAQNLAMLQHISEETARRGLHFQLGLWTHAYQWVDSPKANYVIQGLTPETHGPYCRDALQSLLQACPAINGVTFRIHGESGVAEGSYDFWETVFDGVTRCGRKVEIDMHAKGIDDRMIELGLATGMPVKVSPKFWAEHMGLGYMQGAIRPLELPPREQTDQGFFAKSSGSRRFLRYGYGDLLKENRAYGVLHRIWPGTQRLLLWADPEMAADYGRAASFCGSVGVEWCEPLSFKGRKGSGLPGGRNAYEDASLRPEGGDFEKYLLSYRVWGRRIYDPECSPEEWRRSLRPQFGSGAAAIETAVSQASRILPLVTTAHCPSAANNNYWPEMYTNMAIVDAKRPHPYGDTLSPKRFGTVSSLDPEFFSRVDDYAEELYSGDASARYSPVQVAAWLESYSTGAEKALAQARGEARRPQEPEFRRIAADVALESGLGRFFAWKFRAAVLFALYQRSQYRPALDQALKAYRQARTAWAHAAEGAKGIYRTDVTFGPGAFQRGHWQDRLPAIDADIADMETLMQNDSSQAGASKPASSDRLERAIKAVLTAPPAPKPALTPDFHQSPKSFRPGTPVPVEASVGHERNRDQILSIHLQFRRVNQGETWRRTEMQQQGLAFRASIPGTYTDSPFPLQYHFELRERSGLAWFFPGLKQGWQGQPYFVVRQA
jgi:hypothetical protein